jgi:hypothetical protein
MEHLKADDHRPHRRKPIFHRRNSMQTLTLVAIVASALSLGASSAYAENETDRALGAGAYIHPNGPARGVWVETAPRAGHLGAYAKHSSR